jgi:hypothetical protein
MKVAWLADLSNTDGSGIGGAEMTAAEFAQAAPKGVQVVYVPKTELELARDCDVACVFNCALYPPETKSALSGRRVVRYWNDVAPHGDEALTRWLVGNATNVFTSPLHADRFPWFNGSRPDFHLIPPPVDLKPFVEARERSQGRAGAVSVAPWRGWGKNPYLTQQWAAQTGTRVDYFGGGQLAPPGSQQVPYDQMPDLLARYRTFVYLPSAIEPFCRVAAEAYAAGCEVVVNNLVGARHYLNEENIGLVDTSREAFWKLVAR